MLIAVGSSKFADFNRDHYQWSTIHSSLFQPTIDFKRRQCRTGISPARAGPTLFLCSKFFHRFHVFISSGTSRFRTQKQAWDIRQLDGILPQTTSLCPEDSDGFL